MEQAVNGTQTVVVEDFGAEAADFILMRLDPDNADAWGLAMEEYRTALGKGRFGYSPQTLKMLTKGQLGAVFELYVRAEAFTSLHDRVGSFGVEARTDPMTGKKFPSIMWLTVEPPHRLTEDLVDVIFGHVAQVAKGLGSDCFMVGGRPGWAEHPAMKHLEKRLVRQEFEIKVE